MFENLPTQNELNECYSGHHHFSIKTVIQHIKVKGNLAKHDCFLGWRVLKLTLAKAFSLSEFCEVSFLEFQTNAICILPENIDKLINSWFPKTISDGLI